MFFKLLKISTNALKINRLRSFLTVLGVVIGISSVIIILSAGEAIKQFVIDQIEDFGSDIIEVEVKVPSTKHTSSDNAIGQAMGIAITTLKDADTQAIKKISNVKQVYSGLMGQALAVKNDKNKNTTLLGSSSSFINIDAAEVEFGRFFTKEENKNLAQVVILGSDIKKVLFNDNQAIGEYIKLGKNNYRVIGIMKKRGGAMFFNWDDLIYLPIRTLQKKIMGVDYISYLVADMKDSSRADETKQEIEYLLRQRHHINDPTKDDFAVSTMAEMKDMLGTILGGVQILLIAISSISLLVGGIGIMNIMYVSVVERTFEIGLRKSIGATDKNILWQFLLEAVFITFIGAIIGIIIGIIATWLISQLAESKGYDFKFIMPWWAIVVATGFAVFVGLVFGIYPAKKAASLEPIEALRK